MFCKVIFVCGCFCGCLFFLKINLRKKRIHLSKLNLSSIRIESHIEFQYSNGNCVAILTYALCTFQQLLFYQRNTNIYIFSIYYTIKDILFTILIFY